MTSRVCLWAGFSALAVGALAASCTDQTNDGSASSSSGAGAGTAQCASATYGCECDNRALDLGGRTATSSCAANAGKPLQCCYDLASDGTSSTCACVTYICKNPHGGGYDCMCGFESGAAIPAADLLDSCSAATGNVCCDSDIGCSCGMGSFNGTTWDHACRSYETKVAQCPATKTLTCDGVANRSTGPASSCNGLTWRAPPSGSSSGGNCMKTGDTCGGDVDCCPGHGCNTDSSSSNYRHCS